MKNFRYYSTHKKCGIACIGLLIIILICVIIMFITKPKNSADVLDKIEEVSVTVLNVESETNSMKNNHTVRYYVDIECDGEKYHIGPMSNGGYTPGIRTMYRLENRFYPDLDSALAAEKDSNSSELFRGASGIMFVCVIMLIYFFSAFVQSRDKNAKPSKLSDHAQTQNNIGNDKNEVKNEVKETLNEVKETLNEPILDSDKVIELMGTNQKIGGGMDYIRFEYENNYQMKAYGELRPGATFLVYKRSMKKWEAPHENDIVDAKVINAIIEDIQATSTPEKVKIIFE